MFVLPLLYLWFGSRENGRNHALLAGYCALLALAVNFLITMVYFHPRPFMQGLGTLLIEHAPETSFPSDHTTAMLSCALMLLAFRSTRILGVVLTILGVAGGLARVFCGIHFPFDIFGSAIVAVLAVIIIKLLQNRLEAFNKYIFRLYDAVLGKTPLR